MRGCVQIAGAAQFDENTKDLREIDLRDWQ